MLPKFAEQDAFHIVLMMAIIAAADAFFGVSVANQAFAAFMYIVARETEDYLANRNLRDAARDSFYLVVGAAAGIAIVALV